MAKFGIALRSGRRGRRFKSCHLDKTGRACFASTSCFIVATEYEHVTCIGMDAPFGRRGAATSGGRRLRPDRGRYMAKPCSRRDRRFKSPSYSIVKNMARFAIRHSFFAIRHRNIDIIDIRVTMQISGKETYFCVLRRF